MKKSSINLPDTMVQDIRDSMALHPDGPDSITDFIKEAIAAKLARDRAKIEAIKRIREAPDAPAASEAPQDAPDTPQDAPDAD